MSVIIKPEHTTGVVELSSSDDEVSTLSAINSGVPNTGANGRSSTPNPQCSICLDDLTNKCYTDKCWHTFCFECLLRWSNSEATCPLCKKDFNYIYHSFDDDGIHETYDVPILARRESSPRIFIRPLSEMSEDMDRMFRMNLFLDIVRGSNGARTVRSGQDEIDLNHNGLTPFLSDPSVNYPRPNLQIPIIGQALRVRIYVNHLWAEPLSDSTGRFRECTSAYYRENPGQTYRLHAFILRDLVAVRESLRSDGQSVPYPVNTDVTLTNLIMRSLAAYEIRQLHMINILSPFLDIHAIHFCHELYNFAISPYDISGYDRHVQYTSSRESEIPPEFFENALPPIHILGETIVLDSDNEEVVRPHVTEVIEVSSSPDDSDVEILSHSFLSIDPLDSSSSIDQPSTSTGIRNSFDRPNNRYNLRRRRIFSPAVNDYPNYQSMYSDSSEISYPLRVRRRRVVLDSSSDDEESITGTRGSRTALRKSRNVNDKRKKKTKKNKKKKRKINTNDSRSEIRSTNRNHSCSGSSSSSEETDIRPINSFIPPI